MALLGETAKRNTYSDILSNSKETKDNNKVPREFLETGWFTTNFQASGTTLWCHFSAIFGLFSVNLIGSSYRPQNLVPSAFF